MPRPYIERTQRALRLPTTLDVALVADAAKRGESVNTWLTEAVRARLSLVGATTQTVDAITNERPPKCAHPISRRIGIRCVDCGETIGGRKR